MAFYWCFAKLTCWITHLLVGDYFRISMKQNQKYKQFLTCLHLKIKHFPIKINQANAYWRILLYPVWFDETNGKLGRTFDDTFCLEKVDCLQNFRLGTFVATHRTKTRSPPEMFFLGRAVSQFWRARFDFRLLVAVVVGIVLELHLYLGHSSPRTDLIN